MRVLLYAILVLVLSCEDKQTKPNVLVPKQTKSENKPSKQADSTEKETPKFPFLTDENAMEFFLEYEKHNQENTVRISTRFGNIDILLFPETKFHRANFIYLTKRGYFNKTQFYRVVNNFVIQAGNTDDPKVKRKRADIGRYLLPPDTKRGFKHHRGVVSMPSSDIENAYKLASPFEFFIVQKQDGAYHLDGNYTIFGKVIAGMDVVDQIAAQETDRGEWPLRNIYIKDVTILN
ncbi:peptidylprolyl isomerase [Bizionia sediminis]|uniref:Peptidyl-prolyl cis-trans isomerase n=1 Tax=Bizionia sediminis TaxID=1737064 RepID=A0ABW5KQ94_9FLAO